MTIFAFLDETDNAEREAATKAEREAKDVADAARIRELARAEAKAVLDEEMPADEGESA